MARKLYSEDKSMYARFGKCKDGTFTAIVYMASFVDEEGNTYPEIGFDKIEGFPTKRGAELWASLKMDAREWKKETRDE